MILESISSRDLSSGNPWIFTPVLIHCCYSASLYVCFFLLGLSFFPFWLLKENTRLAQFIFCAIYKQDTERTSWVRCLGLGPGVLYAQNTSTDPLNNAEGEAPSLKRVMDGAFKGLCVHVCLHALSLPIFSYLEF